MRNVKSPAYADPSLHTPLDHTGELDRYDDPAPPAVRPRRWLRTLRRFIQVCAALFLTAFLVALGMTLPYRWHDVDDTAFMRANPTQPVVYQWVDLDHISRYPITSAIVLEDSQLGKRGLAFDLSDFADTVGDYLLDKDPVGGSTIPQQLAKNLYLNDNRSAWRKAAEAPLSLMLNVTAGDRRVLELYMNVAQFGDHLYGICAASWYYFDSPPWSLSLHEGAQLAAILRLPDQARRAQRGGIYVLGPESSKDFRENVYTVVPDVVAWVGGYQVIMEQVGITDDASDHAADRTRTDSCSTMPDDVRALLTKNGY